MLSLAYLLLQAATPASAVQPPTIVVRGVRLQTLKEELDGCIARTCSPREDIIASVRYAEGLFRTGAYVESKRVLMRSVSRNKGAAKADPLAVSELYLAEVNVAIHEGDQQLARSAAYTRAGVLRNAYTDSQPAVLFADLSVADMILRTADWREAARMYASLAKRAEGQPRVAAAIALRRANLASRYGQPSEAKAFLAPVLAASGDDMAGYRTAARALTARFARQRGDDGATEALLAAMAREPRQAAPTLLWSPPLRAPNDPAGLDYFQRTDPTTRSTDLASLGWIDVGFLIRPDGTVEEPEILRGAKGQGWTVPVLQTVAGRRYAPFGAPDGAGQYRVQRFTLTADYTTPQGSLIRRRLRNPRIEEIDLTTAPPVAVAAG